jgi:hypothetical protein
VATGHTWIGFINRLSLPLAGKPNLKLKSWLRNINSCESVHIRNKLLTYEKALDLLSVDSVFI